MVMQEGESQEVVGQDILDLDQQVLDQGMMEEAVAPQYVTLEQFDQMMSNHQKVTAENQNMRNHISGLESRIDKQANAFHVEMQNQADATERRQAQDLQNRILENFDDPDQRVLWQQYFETQNSTPATPQFSSPEEPVYRPAPQQQVDQWADVQKFIRDMGLDPADKRFDYTILVNENLTATQRQEQFLANVGDVASSRSVSPNAEQVSPSSAQVPAQTPQRSAGPTGTGFRNSEDLMDAFINGKVDANKYRELAPKFGIPL
jgi:hypothetical protein